MIKTRKDRCQDTYSPLRLVAGRLLADGLGGAVVCWRLLLLSEAGRLLAFLGAGDARREGRRRRGDGLPGMAAAGNDPAAICGGDS